ncbi:MAG: hypothetical protein ACO4BJ_10120 [Planctomycetota bacterium]
MATSMSPPAAAPDGTKPGGHPTRAFQTVRTDNWKLGPLLTVAGLGAFVLYSTWRAFSGVHYWVEPYLSPFYSPLIYANPQHWAGSPIAHAWFGEMPQALIDAWPSFLPFALSPAFFILVFPGSFRATCYYYRKAYYRSFFGTPPAARSARSARRNTSGSRGSSSFRTSTDTRSTARSPSSASSTTTPSSPFGEGASGGSGWGPSSCS